MCSFILFQRTIKIKNIIRIKAKSALERNEVTGAKRIYKLFFTYIFVYYSY